MPVGLPVGDAEKVVRHMSLDPRRDLWTGKEI